jgi:hypothetical protein
MLVVTLTCATPAFGQAPAPAAPAAPVAVAPAPDSAPAEYDRFHEFIHNTIKSPAFHIEAAAAGAIDQANHFPKQWDEGDGAVAKRLAARFGQAFTAGIIEVGVAEALNYHVGYERCSCSGGLRRLGHAVVHTFVVSRVRGGTALNTPFLVSRYSSAALAKAWYPDSYRAGDVVSQATFSLGSAVGLNILDEFGPDVLHLFHLH